MNTKTYSKHLRIVVIVIAIILVAAKLYQIYHEKQTMVSLLDGYTASEYQYQALGPGKEISGTKYTIPASLAAGTNLSTDSYISLEKIPGAASCNGSLFLDLNTSGTLQTLTENGITYSVVSSSDAGAGNRYEETVYALSGSNPCTAVRYFIHYGAIGNYPEGTVTEFDKEVLMKKFDEIRAFLVKE